MDVEKSRMCGCSGPFFDTGPAAVNVVFLLLLSGSFYIASKTTLVKKGIRRDSVLGKHQRNAIKMGITGAITITVTAAMALLYTPFFPLPCVCVCVCCELHILTSSESLRLLSSVIPNSNAL